MHCVWGRIKSAYVKVIDNRMGFTNSWHNINCLVLYIIYVCVYNEIPENPNVIYLYLNHFKQSGSKPSRSACY